MGFSFVNFIPTYREGPRGGKDKDRERERSEFETETRVQVGLSQDWKSARNEKTQRADLMQ